MLPRESGDMPAKHIPRRRREWDGVAAIIAALVGLLALCVSGYTAYIQRQQVRAQVWPYLIAGNNDNEHSIEVYNKGVGPAIVRSAEVWVDGKPQKDWKHVLEALAVNKPFHFTDSTINPNVLSPGEKISMIKFPRKMPGSNSRRGGDTCDDGDLFLLDPGRLLAVQRSPSCRIQGSHPAGSDRCQCAQLSPEDVFND